MEIMTRHSPSGWALYRLGQLFAERREKVSDKDFQPLSVTMNGIVPQLDSAAKSDDGDNRKLVRAGDYVINSRSDRKGSGGVSPLDGSVSLISIVLEPLRIHPPFAHHLLRSPAFQEEFYRWGHGIVADLWTTRYSDMKSIRLYLPDIASQKRIADFLDTETTRIDELIERKQRLVEVVGEGLAACLERLTSPHEKTTDMIPFRWVCRVVEGQVDPTHPDWVGAPLIAPNHIQSGTGRLLAVETAEEQGAISGKYAYRAGTVLYSKIRPALAKACIAPDAGMCSADMYPILPDRRLSPEFLLMQLLSRRFTDWATLESMRVAMPKINRETIGNYRLWVPSRETQVKNAEVFAMARDKAEATIDRVEASITRLREYRAALITAAVTGQIDVAAHARPVKTVPRHVGADVVPLHANPQSMSLPDRRTVRVLVAAEVVHRLGVDPYLGRIKLQKLMFLAEAHANINEIDGSYERYRAGPYDGAMMTEIETGLRQEQFFAATEDATSDRRRITFQRMPRAGNHRDSLSATLGDRVASLRSMVDLFKDMSTEAAEAVATLYAVWNDALIDNQQLDDAAIIRGFLREWHKDKDKFRQSDLQHWLDWMHRKGIVPRGAGPRTISTSTPSLFEGE